MAQSGYTPISLYYTTTAAAVPTSGNLVNGELAINITDGKLYYKNNSGVVTLLAGATSGPAGGSNTQVQYNNSGVLNGITGATTNGTALTLVAPVLGTPASGVATNLTGLPLTTGVTGTLPVANGGTGLTAGTSGGLLAYTATGTLASSALLTLYGVVYGGGVGAVPVATAAGTTGQVLQATTGGAPVWGSTYAGSVSSVGFTGGLISVATATTTPALTVAGTSGGVVYFSSASTWASSALLSANSLMIGGGSGAAPATTTTGTGVVTALGVNTGTAGAFVVNGGALGSPSSAGTIPAFTLGGTVAGGGNQLNNVIIGTTTPLAGAFTTLSSTINAGGNTAVAETILNTGGNTAVKILGTAGGTAGAMLNARSDGSLRIYQGTTTGADGTQAAVFDSTGLAVTGTLTVGSGSTTSAGFTAGYLGFSGYFGLWATAIASPDGTNYSLNGNATTTSLNGATYSQLRVANTVIAQASSTGLYVTGTLSATGTISATGGSVSSVVDPAMTINYQRVLRFNDSSNTSWAGYIISSGTALGVGGNTSITFDVGGATYATLTSSGLAVTGLVDISAATSGQIKFPATQNASSNANTLDDYEEGTWTPAATATTTAPAVIQTGIGFYTKIGRQVTVTCSNLDSVSMVGSVGGLKITGLPFTCGSSTGNGAMGSCVFYKIDTPAGAVNLSAWVSNNSNFVTFFATFDNAVYDSVVDNSTVDGRIWFTVTYFV